ncbi:hypothetical protein ACYJ2U_001764 [Clostridium botulinum]
MASKPKMKCQGKCQGTKSVDKFYRSQSPKHEVFGGYCPYCKDCLKKLVYANGVFDVEKLKFVLKNYLDKPFFSDIIDSVMTTNTANPLGMYLKQLNLRKQIGNDVMTWKDGETGETNDSKDNAKNTENKIIKKKIDKKTLEQMEKSKKDVLKLLGYDPFDGYPEDDKGFLYNDLVPYLDEDTLEDAFKVSVILQIVNNNNQIRKINLIVNNIGSNMEDLLQNSEQINKLTSIKKNLNDQNDKLSKENNIALKHRGDSSSRNSTLGSMMKNLRELDFEKAEQDYYDMMKCHGMKVSADISNKSILEILKFDENDIENMFKMQRDTIQQLQESELDLKEKNRLLNVDIHNLKEEIKKLKGNKK